MIFSIGFHEGSNTGIPTVGIDRFEDRAARHMILPTTEMMPAAMSVILAACASDIRESAWAFPGVGELRVPLLLAPAASEKSRLRAAVNITTTWARGGRNGGPDVNTWPRVRLT